MIFITTTSCNWFFDRDFSFTPTTQLSQVATTVPTAEQFDQLLAQEQRPILVKVSAPWCKNCKKMEPLFHYLAESFHKNYLFVILTVSESTQQIIDRYSITGLPTFLFLKNGKEINPAKRIVGRTTKATLLSTMNELFGAHHE